MVSGEATLTATADSLTSTLWSGQVLVSDYLGGQSQKPNSEHPGLWDAGLPHLSQRAALPSCPLPTPINKENIGLLRPLPALP